MTYDRKRPLRSSSTSSSSAALMSDQTSIAIVGSALAGLSTAICLEQAGFRNITIYERDESFDCRRDGYGLTLKYDPKGVLQKLDILEDCALADCPSRSHYLLTSQGQVRGYFGNAFHNNHAKGFGQRGNLRVPRQAVRRMLMNRLKVTTICWNHKLINLQALQKELINDGTTQDSKTVQMRLKFSGKEPVLADWVIAADGIRSSVVASVLPDAPPPRPMGVRLILGLTSDKTGVNGLNLNHSLLKERGFYSLSSGHRLFVMPYSAASPLHPTTETRYMWQLSFTEDADQASSASGMSPLDLQRGALERCREWHSPVEDLIRSTPLDAIWSTHLCDRDPKLLQDLLLQKIAKQQGSASDPSYFDRVILIGDALHAMSCFKGQGANQALLDGTVVGKWFAMALSGACKSPLATLRGCMREMVQRTAPIVAASRVAAMHWHSSAALSEAHTLAGVSQDRVDELLGRLKERNIVVDSVADLDTAIRIELKAIGIAKQDETGDAKPVSTQWVEAVVYATEAGDLRRLRELSWSSSHSCWLQRITSNEGNTCLHIAVENGHLEIVNWLVTQAGFDPSARNTTGRTPKEMAKDMVVGELMEQLQLHSTFNST